MTWHTSVGTLTAIVAHDAKTFSGSNLTDKTAGNRTLSIGTNNYIGRIREGNKEYSAVIGQDSAMNYSSSVSLPTTGCTIFALMRLRQRSLLINAGASGVAGNYYMAIEPELESPTTQPRIYGGGSSLDARISFDVRGKIVAYAMTFTSSTSGQQFVDGLRVSNTTSITSQPTVSTGINYPGWFLKSDLLCFGIFNGVATSADLITMQDAALAFMEETLSADTVFDETFDTSIPANFGPLILSTAGSATATYNATDKCIDIVSTAASHNAYRLPGWYLSKGEIEADIEITGTRSGVVGIAFQGVLNSSLQGLNIYSDIAAPTANGPLFVSRYANASVPPTFTVLQQNYQTLTGFFNNVGERKVIRLAFDLVPFTTKGWAALFIDSVKVLEFKVLYAYAGNFAIYFNNQNFKIHRVKQTNATSYNSPNLEGIGTNFLEKPIDGDTWQELNALSTISTLIKDDFTFKDMTTGTMEPSGSGVISGTLKTKSTPDNTPTQRKVYLMHEKTKTIIKETISNPITGAYTFEYLQKNTPYTILAYDDVNLVYPAVIASGILPDEMV